MGTYLNPGNGGFLDIRQRNYVDKTGLIAQINKVIGTSDKLTCISRPRRFGKSFAAQMLCAYYDKTCDSSVLFDDLAIAKFADYKAHLNHYDVIYIDMTGVKPATDGFHSLVPFLTERPNTSRPGKTTPCHNQCVQRDRRSLISARPSLFP